MFSPNEAAAESYTGSHGQQITADLLHKTLDSEARHLADLVKDNKGDELRQCLVKDSLGTHNEKEFRDLLYKIQADNKSDRQSNMNLPAFGLVESQPDIWTHQNTVLTVKLDSDKKCDGKPTNASQTILIDAGDRACYLATGGDMVVAEGGSQVYAHDHSTVIAKDESFTRGSNQANVIAGNGSVVQVEGNATATAEKGSSVYPSEHASVTANRGSQVLATNQARVTAKSGAFVEAFDNSRVIAKSGSVICAKDHALVQAQDGAIVELKGHARIDKQ
jgi:hypothetical protein